MSRLRFGSSVRGSCIEAWSFSREIAAALYTANSGSRNSGSSCHGPSATSAITGDSTNTAKCVST